jgi:hypothetical protein
MRSNRRLVGRYDWSYGERFAVAVALVVLSLLWLTETMALWAIAVAWAGAVGGVIGMLYCGWRYIRTRGDSH